MTDKRSVSLLRRLGTFLMLFALLGAAPSPAVQSVAEKQRAENVRRALERLPYYGVFDFIAFNLDRGTATLMGYAYAPNLFGFFAFIPALGVVVSTVVSFWLLAATILAVRQALDYVSTWRAAAVVLMGWLIFVVVQWVS